MCRCYSVASTHQRGGYVLAIRKRYRLLKTISAGSLAFAVGLTGAAAYVGSTVAHQNLTFSKEQTTASDSSKTADSNAGSVTVDDAAATGSGLYAPQNSFAESPMSSTPASSQVTVAPSAAGQVVDTATQTTESPSQSTGPNDNTLILCADLPLFTVPLPNVNCRY